MSEKLGQPIIVDNRPGADTLVGILYAKDQPADGYTILAQSLGFSTLPYIKLDPGYTLSDFTGIGTMSRIPFILLVGGSESVQSMTELAARAKKEQLAYGHGGVASAPHIAAELFLRCLRSADDVGSLQGQRRGDAGCDGRSLGVLLRRVYQQCRALKSGKMKALAVAAPERLPVLPNVPTFKELGVDFTYTVWLGLLVRSGTPPDIVAKLSDALRYALESKDLAERFRADGSDITFMGPQEFTDYLASEYAEMGKVANDLKFVKE